MSFGNNAELSKYNSYSYNHGTFVAYTITSKKRLEQLSKCLWCGVIMIHAHPWRNFDKTYTENYGPHNRTMHLECMSKHRNYKRKMEILRKRLDTI